MKLTAYLIDESVLEVADFDAESSLDLLDGLSEQQFVMFQMDDATVIVNRDHVVRIDIDHEQDAR